MVWKHINIAALLKLSKYGSDSCWFRNHQAPQVKAPWAFSKKTPRQKYKRILFFRIKREKNSGIYTATNQIIFSFFFRARLKFVTQIADKTKFLTNQLESQDTLRHGPFDIIVLCGSEVIASQKIHLKIRNNDDALLSRLQHCLLKRIRIPQVPYR